MASAAPSSTLLTVEDYLALPEDHPRCELLDGELYMLPSPSKHHQFVITKLVYFIQAHLESHEEGMVFAAPFDVILEETSAVQPDVLFVSNDTLDTMGDRLYGVPDLAVEILSPSNAVRDLTAKRAKYRSHHVKELWFVDPETKIVQVDRLGATDYEETVVYSEADTLQSPLLPGLEIPVKRLFYPR